MRRDRPIIWEEDERYQRAAAAFMAIVIVGDRKVIEPGLRELGYPINVLDADGNPVTQ